MTYRPVADAIESFIKVKNAIDILANKVEKMEIKEKAKKKEEIEETKKKIRSRSREIPPMILDVGLVPTLSFILAKATLENLRLVVNIAEESGQVTSQLSAIPSSTELSYAFYAYIIFRFLEKYLGPKCPGTSLKDSAADAKRLERYVEEYLKRLSEDMNSQIALKLLKPYLGQFKRLCEAEFPKE